MFCNACGYYLKKRQSIAVLLLLTSAVVIVISLSFVFEEEWFWWLLLLVDVGGMCFLWIYLLPFGFSKIHYMQWKARRRRNRELKR